ncbi:MAG: hypothetical protein HY819_10855 [Acidobacteria bacterium]|nr:hypothetical protein [Acidobacteriota bacterium]
MPWKVVERRIGRAGGVKERTARQREWNKKYGDGSWAIGYIIDGDFILQEDALETIYYKSYEEHFANHSEDLEELIQLAKELRNPHSEATTGVDLQVATITEYLKRNNLSLQGKERVDIGSWNGQASHPISIRLSPLHIKVTGDPKTTLEKFWQDRKCLAIWED